MSGDTTQAVPGILVPDSPRRAPGRIHAATDAPDRWDTDVVIVGCGPGGSSAARALAAAGWRVVVLEEGPARSRFRPSWTHTTRYHFQEAGTMVAEGPVPFPVMAGRGVGGGSLVNSAICFRTPPDVLRGWAELLDDARFGPDALSSVYDEIEARIGVVPVSEAIAGENNLLIARGVAKLGPPLEGGLLRRNAPGCIGCGICNFGCPSGGKASVDRTLLVDAIAWGADVQADCRVDSVIVEGGRARGVRAFLEDPDTGDRVRPIEARGKVVVLSAGAIGTPRLLWHCGLAAELGPVGEQLHLHPGSAVISRCDYPVQMWKGATQGAYVWSPEQPKVLPHTLNVPPEALIGLTGAVGPKSKEMLADLIYWGGLGVMVSDKGHGSVRARADGRAKLRYRWDDGDVEILRRGMVLSARVLFAGGASEVFASAHGAERHRDLAAFEAEVMKTPLRAMQLYSSHPMSTCLMGLDPETSVVDPRGRAHRLPGLRFADASSFPTSLGVNPQLTTMVLGTLVGRAIAEDGA